MNNTRPIFSPDLISCYAADFREHRGIVHKHLQGQLEGSQRLLPSFLPPASYWTSEEKDLFFHGLTIYSRLRPDLIAADIKTKNTLDVCVYMDCLQTAASRKSYEVISDYPEPAMELSEDLVCREGMLSEALNSLESCSWSAIKDGIHTQPSCMCPSFSSAATSPLPADAYLNHLDSICLMTQESILREAEMKPDFGSGAITPAVSESLEVIQASVSNENTDSVQREGNSPFYQSTEMSLNAVLNDENLSASNKKLQRLLKKRLYMRRKRAELASKDVVIDSLKLRPGRRKKDRKPSKPRPKNYNTPKTNPQSEFDSINQTVEPGIASFHAQPGSTQSKGLNDEDFDSMYEKHSQSGLTRPYRVKKFFQENGVDAQVLSGMDINFFHLSTLTRLMRLYNSINDPEDSLDSVSLSAHTIQLFADITKDFISEVIRRAVITKEQEVRLKRTMKVWKYERDEITVENVAECLYSMGLGRLDKEEYFADLFGNQGQDSSSSVTSPHAGTDQKGKENHRVPIDNLSKDHFYRTPQYTLPNSLKWCSLPAYRSLYPEDDEIVLNELDAKQLEQELDEDEELDAQDRKISEEFEALLWKMMG